MHGVGVVRWLFPTKSDFLFAMQVVAVAIMSMMINEQPRLYKILLALLLIPDEAVLQCCHGQQGG